MAQQQRQAQVEAQEAAEAPPTLARTARLEWSQEVHCTPAPPVAEPQVTTADEDLERPDWSAHFASTPLNVMEEAARKMMARGAQGAPAWQAWREDLRTEAKDLAATWGKRDKNTRVAGGAAAAPVETTKASAPRANSATSMWNQEA